MNGVWTQVWVIEAASEQEIADRVQDIQNDIINRTQDRLDNFARTRNYAGILSLCSYAASSNQTFQNEASYGVIARDATWATLYAILAEVQAGTRPIPSGYSEIESELPALQWPV